jgi:hypothetical protein
MGKRPSCCAKPAPRAAAHNASYPPMMAPHVSTLPTLLKGLISWLLAARATYEARSRQRLTEAEERQSNHQGHFFSLGARNATWMARRRRTDGMRMDPGGERSAIEKEIGLHLATLQGAEGRSRNGFWGLLPLSLQRVAGGARKQQAGRIAHSQQHLRTAAFNWSWRRRGRTWKHATPQHGCCLFVERFAPNRPAKASGQ